MRARCFACGAPAPYGQIRCLTCGKPLCFPVAEQPQGREAMIEPEVIAAMSARSEEKGVLSLWTVYDKPSDVPGRYVAQRFELRPLGKQPTLDVLIAEDLADMRKALEDAGFVKLDRHPNDEAEIIESWV
jgi:hypothetical protein